MSKKTSTRRSFIRSTSIYSLGLRRKLLQRQPERNDVLKSGTGIPAWPPAALCTKFPNRGETHLATNLFYSLD
jgi:hypothetical protein